MKRKFIIGISAVLALGAAAALAAWFVVQIINVPGNDFGTGTPVSSNYSVIPTSAVWPAVTAAEPGTGTFGKLSVGRSSSGIGNRFAVTSAHTDAVLAAGLRARVSQLAVNGSCTQTLNLDGTSGALQADEVELYNGTLAAVAVGDPTLGAQAGDIVHNVPGTKYLCFSVMLPSDAPASLAGLTNATTITVHGDASP